MQTRKFLLGTGVLLAAVTAFAGAVTMMSVQVRKAQIRDTPSFLGKVLQEVSYGDRVSAGQSEGGWIPVTANGRPGWMHSSALTTKTIVMKGGSGAQAGASSGEMALAGKGFNSDVEAQFKASHKDIDFGPVDRMEKIRIPPATLQQFAQSGGLKPAEGGAR